jgi:cytochrome c
MKITLLACAAALCASNAVRADEPVSFEQGAKLMAKYNCQACHSQDKTMAGPSLRDVSKRYASNPNAQGELEQNILNGSSGAWGPAGNVMPATQIPETDLKPLVEWILSLR